MQYVNNILLHNVQQYLGLLLSGKVKSVSHAFNDPFLHSSAIIYDIKNEYWPSVVFGIVTGSYLGVRLALTPSFGVNLNVSLTH